ncbi:3D domain-containing protein [Patescibacteria group bacterium]|nr:3D domain-containing protein [Patescibacteria group bacterium]
MNMKHMINRETVTIGITVALLVGIPAIGLQMQDTADEPPSITERIVIAQSTSLLPISSPKTPTRVARTVNVIVTAYSSTPEQTDDTPFITASGNWVRDGIVATNILPMGTKIKIPEVYGDRIFVVDDRMHPRKRYNVDIWFPSYWEAKNFGVKRTYIEVLES